MSDLIGAAGFDQSRPQHAFAHPFQPIRQVEQFLLEARLSVPTASAAGW
jgi:hypothetical protein